MTQFVDLPMEIISRCAEHLEQLGHNTGFHKQDLLNFACTSSNLYRVAIPILYTTFLYSKSCDKSGEALPRYIESLHRCPHFATHLRHLVLLDWCWPARHAVWKQLDEMTQGKIMSPDTLATFLCTRSTQLRSLEIDYPLDGTFLNLQSTNIEKLKVRPAIERWPAYDIDSTASGCLVQGMLKVDFLPYALSWPKFKSLKIEATSVVMEDELLRLNDPKEFRTSSLNEIILRPGNFMEEAMSVLLHMPKRLTSLSYLPPTSEDTTSSWDAGSYADVLPRTSVIGSALRCHVGTLKRLALSRAGGQWNSRLDLLESLRDFTCLEHLEVDASMLLGWDHCPHLTAYCMKHDISTASADPVRLVSMLPPNINHLAIIIDKNPHQQGLVSYVRTIAEGIVTEMRTGQLNKLRTLRFRPSKCGYCLDCDREARTYENFATRWLFETVGAFFYEVAELLESLGCSLTVNELQQAEVEIGSAYLVVQRPTMP